MPVGGAATLTASTTGTPTPTYQWQKDRVNIVGATSNPYTIANVAASDEGSFTVVATNFIGSLTSNAAVLEVIIPPSNAVIAVAVD